MRQLTSNNAMTSTLPTRVIKGHARSNYTPLVGHSVAIIGCGWSGAHIASELAGKGYSVTVFETKHTLFSGISGSFGIRIHAGPHYPRSYATRTSCHYGATEFRRVYPELICEHSAAVYAIGRSDADKKPSKTSADVFRSICREYAFKGEVDLAAFGLNPSEIDAAYDLDEPSALLGEPLRQFFQKRLSKRGVIIKYNFSVTNIEKNASGMAVINGEDRYVFHHVINTTSFQSLLPSRVPLPFDLTVVYQPLLALRYRDITPDKKPLSLITMDGMFPCLMPVVCNPDTDQTPVSEYIMTHAKYTTLGSYQDVDKAVSAYQLVDDLFIERHVRAPTEAHMKRLWPVFSKRFQYLGWKGAVLAKIRTNTEFRAAITFQDPDSEMIYVFPGKITNVFEAEKETRQLMTGRGVTTTASGYRYVAVGALGPQTQEEIRQNIQDKTRNTGYLQPHENTLFREGRFTIAQESDLALNDKHVVHRPAGLIQPASSAHYFIGGVEIKKKILRLGWKITALFFLEFAAFLFIEKSRHNILTGTVTGLVVFFSFLAFDASPLQPKISRFLSMCLFTPFVSAHAPHRLPSPVRPNNVHGIR